MGTTGTTTMGVQQQFGGRKIIHFVVHAMHAPHHPCHMAFLFIAISTSAFVTRFLLCATSRCALWYRRWLPLSNTHYPPCSLFLHLLAMISFFSVCCLATHKSHSPFGLCTTVVSIALRFESSSWGGNLHPTPTKRTPCHVSKNGLV